MTTENHSHTSNSEKLFFFLKLLLLACLLYVEMIEPKWKQALHVPQYVVSAIFSM